MAASSSTAASVSTAPYSNNNQLYEVFINHRGVDTKETFARSLYLRLLQHGLRPFPDMNEMQTRYELASQIKNAIRTASVHVAILSARYAESTWCLDELLEMLESKATIIPVFYDVKPSQVRWTRGKVGIYAQDLERLAKKRDHDSKPRNEPHTIEKWRNALSQVAKIRGFELKRCDIGEDVQLELELVDKVVKCVSEIVKTPWEFEKIGLDEKMSLAKAPSTAAQSNNNQWYEFFINHRGIDVKQTFARSLYLRLLEKGFRGFRNIEDVQPGYNLESLTKHAIRTASVHVVIFSSRFAESSLCLDKLLLILESKAPIIPVFYGVTPAQVRWTRGKDGIYAQALERLAKKRDHDSKPLYDPHTIENWRNALSQLADISGFELNGCDIGEDLELNLLDEVVKSVSETVQRSWDVSWDENEIFFIKIGLDEKVKDFESKVLSGRHQSANPQVVGVVGLGGVGKTTLAKEFFDRKRLHYSRSCFLYNVRENAGKGCLTDLQSKLFKSLTQSDLPIDSINGGIEALKKHLSSCRVLVILDDVDHVNQIDALLPVRTDLLSDSLVVITSRDKKVIRSSGVENASIYKLSGLNKQHSQELFCAYAFSQPHPPRGLESLVDNFLEACDGLPLSLKVFGALLYGKDDQSDLKDLLDRLPSAIEEVFQISYQSLSTEQQQMFLDTACFFIGQKRDTAIRIWEGSGWEGRLGFQTLQERCLLEMDSENNIDMHDHIRDFGRGVAVTLLPRRLWHCTHINDMLEQFSNEQVTTVRGIKMVLGEYNDNVDAFGGIDMRTLELVDTENGILERILRWPMHPRSLIWLRWNKCPNFSLPSWITMENLRVLQVSGSVLKTLWEGESQAPWQLRELEINAPLSNIPESIGRLMYLERIVVGRFLSGQVNLTKLPKEFCRLRSLKALELTYCSKMKSLPDFFGHLLKLKHIDLSFCRNLERLPDSLGILRELQHINLSDCHDLVRLPDSIGLLRRLRHIDLRGCHNLERLPISFGNLTDLRHINLSGCHDLQRLPDSFGNLTYLQHIDLQGCHNLEELPISFGDLKNLQHINFSNCHYLERLPDSFGNLRNLQYIDLSGCHNLERLPNYLRNLNKLKYLDVEGCSNLIVEANEIPDNLQEEHQRHLEQLYLSDV